ncbi:MAG: PAS domain-containing protein [Candidatus Hydrogenedentes bacterium]|nr:PAS domain-containing protein [Candidatus Hydrogenedentota bacterium]
MKSVADVLISLGQNMALVLALLFIYQWMESRAKRLGLRGERIGFGLLFGLAACGGMLVPVELTPGVLMDSRGILVALAALFGGVLSGVTAALPPCALRLYLGGDGAWPGTLATLCALLAGLLFARLVCPVPEQVKRRHLLALGLVVGALFLLWTLVLPGLSGLENFRRFLLPLSVIYPVGAVAIGSLILSEIRRRLAETARDRGTALFRQASQATRIGVWELDPVSGKFDWSENVEPLLGLPSGTFKGTYRHFLKQVHREDRPQVLAKVREALSGPDIFGTEFRMQWDDGTTHWYAANGTVQRNGGRGAGKLIGVLTDISERKHAQRDLQASEARLAESQRIARIGSWIWHPKGGFVWCSDEMLNLLGATRSELDSTFDAFLNRVHPPDRMALSEQARRLVRDHATVRVEWRLLHPDGTLHHMLAIARPNLGADGGIIDFRGICQDISTQKLAELGVREREDRYRRLVAGLPICIHEIDREGYVVAINKAGLGMVCASQPSEICGRKYLDIMAPCDRERIAGLFDRALAGEPSEFEVTPVVAGATRIFSSSFIPLMDDDGKVYRIMGHTIDLTHERAREADLHRLGTAIEQAVESIVITDPEAVIEYVNPAYEKITGFTRAESIGKRISIVKSGIHDEDFYTSVWNTISSGQTWQGEFLNRRKNGELFHQRATISPIFGPDGAIVNYVSVQHDITHEVELEKQLRQAQKMEALGTLAGGIAHDFNNILHSMLGFCHIARESGTQDPAALDHNLREIEQGALRAASLVEQILIFSRTSDVRFISLSLVKEVEDALRFLRGSLPPSVNIQFGSGTHGANVFGDPTQIHQLVTNLCTNAVHAMEDRGGTLRVSVDVEQLAAPRQTLSGHLPAGSYCVLRVRDDGVGIDPASFDKLFDPFYTTKKVGKGTGLGLSMVHGIATRMDGAVEIESELNRGTCVTVFLPLSQQPAREDHRLDPISLPPARGSGRVLLVDDDVSITNMVSIVLRRQGFEVTAFNDPADALEALRASDTPFDVVICDLTMPRMNGIELSRAIRTLRPNLPILLATGIIDDEKLDDVQESGIREILRKPFHINDLITAINRCV